jgi:serine/threonine protein kinase
MRHPVLPKVSDHFGENEEQYLVMEHIAGDDLAKRLEAAQKPFPVSWVMFWADQLLDALSYLHSHEPPIIHRDIKPQNLKLTDENHIILLDFGLSKTSTGQTHISNTGSTGSVVGYTPHYAPMEQIRGIGTNPRSDLYSLSATLYQLMTNVVPADALTRADSLLNGLADPIEPPHALNPEIPATVSEVILMGMEVSQDKRFGTAREMQKALRRAFTRMQEAMAAQTVAFNLGDVATAEPSVPSPAERTQLMPPEPVIPGSDSVPPLPADNGAVDFDATLAFDPVENLEQVGIRTELFTAPAETNGGVSVPAPAFPAPHEEAEEAHTSFVTVVAGSQDGAAAEDRGAVSGDVSQPTATAAAPSAKKSGRTFAVLGGLAAVLVLAAGAASAAWYFYNNYYAAAAIAEPSPSPEPTVAESPAPAVTTEEVVDSNTSTDTNANITDGSIVDSSSNVNRRDLPGDTPARSQTEASATRQNQTGTRSTNRPAPGAKATPKPRTNPGRTDILQ